MEGMFKFMMNGFVIINEMYENGVIYNDITFDNVLISKITKKFYLFDFGQLFFLDLERFLIFDDYITSDIHLASSTCIITNVVIIQTMK